MAEKTKGRAWISSLKPVWTKKSMEKLAKELKGSAKIYMINHDRDKTEGNNLVEPHTHFVIQYQTPRNRSTVANLLGVKENFILPCKSTQSSLRYLLHLDDPQKAQYDYDEVIHNNDADFKDVIKGQSLSDREIADYIYRGETMAILDLVPYNKIRTIQAIVQMDNDKKMYRNNQMQLAEISKLNMGMEYLNKEIKKVNNKLNKSFEAIGQILDITQDFQKGAVTIGKAINDKMRPFFEEHLIGAFKNIEVIARKALEDRTT